MLFISFFIIITQTDNKYMHYFPFKRSKFHLKSAMNELSFGNNENQSQKLIIFLSMLYMMYLSHTRLKVKIFQKKVITIVTYPIISVSFCLKKIVINRKNDISTTK